MRIWALFLDLTNGAIQDLFDFSPSFLPSGFCSIGANPREDLGHLRRFRTLRRLFVGFGRGGRKGGDESAYPFFRRRCPPGPGSRFAAVACVGANQHMPGRCAHVAFRESAQHLLAALAGTSGTNGPDHPGLRPARVPLRGHARNQLLTLIINIC
jgi:hypothetical protein